MQQQGTPLRDIRAAIDAKFGQFGPATLTEPVP